MVVLWLVVGSDFHFLLFLFWLLVVCFAACLGIESGFVVGVGSSIASVSSKRIFGVIVVVKIHFGCCRCCHLCCYRGDDGGLLSFLLLWRDLLPIRIYCCCY